MKKSMVMFVLIFVEMYGQLDASYCRGMSKDLKRLNDADRFWRQLCEDEEKAEKLLFLKRGVMVARLVVHGNLLPIAVRKSLIEFKDECLTKKNRNDIYNVLISVHDRVWIRGIERRKQNHVLQEEEHNRLLQQTEQVMQKRKERMRQFKHNRKQEQERLKCAQSARLQKNKKLPQSQQRMQVAHRKKW